MGRLRQTTPPRSSYPGRIKQALNCDLVGLVNRGILTKEEARDLRKDLESKDGFRRKNAVQHIDNLIARHRAPSRPRRRKSGRGGKAIRGSYKNRPRGYSYY